MQPSGMCTKPLVACVRNHWLLSNASCLQLKCNRVVCQMQPKSVNITRKVNLVAFEKQPGCILTRARAEDGCSWSVSLQSTVRIKLPVCSLGNQTEED